MGSADPPFLGPCDPDPNSNALFLGLLLLLTIFFGGGFIFGPPLYVVCADSGRTQFSVN